MVQKERDGVCWWWLPPRWMMAGQDYRSCARRSEPKGNGVSVFEVQIEQLRKAATAAGSAADQARTVDPGTGLEAVATALPGGVAAGGAPGLASAFNERARSWAGEIDRWSSSVTAAAKEYTESDDAAKKAFGG
jgi:hypothetical protein